MRKRRREVGSQDHEAPELRAEVHRESKGQTSVKRTEVAGGTFYPAQLHCRGGAAQTFRCMVIPGGPKVFHGECTSGTEQ